MLDAIYSKQLLITVNNEVGSLAEITSVIAHSGINLIAMNSSVVDNHGVIMFVSNDNQQAKELLEDKGFKVLEEEIVLITLDNKPGELYALTKKISEENIDLNLIYGSVDDSGQISRLVLISENNEAVMVAIKMGVGEEVD